MQRRWWILGLSVLLLVSWLGGCGGKTHRRDDLLKQLEARVTAFWSAGMEKDLQVVYDMHTPQYRQKVSPMEFTRLYKDAFRTVRYNIDSLELDDDGKGATVYVTNTFLAPYMPNPKTIPAQQSRWVLVDGAWYVFAETEAPTNISGRRATQ